MEKQSFEELKTQLKKLSSVCIMDGIVNQETDLLVLGNSISIATAVVEIGGDLRAELLLALNPIAERLKEELEKKNPDLKGHLTNLDASKFPGLSDLADSLGRKAAEGVNIADLLTDTGVFTAKDNTKD